MKTKVQKIARAGRMREGIVLIVTKLLKVKIETTSASKGHK
jgi:hypothetical protein